MSILQIVPHIHVRGYYTKCFVAYKHKISLYCLLHIKIFSYFDVFLVAHGNPL